MLGQWAYGFQKLCRGATVVVDVMLRLPYIICCGCYYLLHGHTFWAAEHDVYASLDACLQLLPHGSRTF